MEILEEKSRILSMIALSRQQAMSAVAVALLRQASRPRISAAPARAETAALDRRRAKRKAQRRARYIRRQAR